MKNIVGVDIGIMGGIAYYDGLELICDKMPVDKRNKTSRVNCHALQNILSHYTDAHVYIEQVNAFGMGATSAYNFGWNSACVEAVCACLNMPFTYVTPQVWKKAVSCPTDKDAARMRATQLFPKHAHMWDKKCLDGLAEAAMIALYGFTR